MRPELADLLARMNDDTRDPTNPSVQSVSWYAHREAEGLEDLTLVRELLEYVRRQRSEPKRRNAYFVIGKLGQRCLDSACTEILIAELARNTSKYTISSLLDRIADLPKPLTVDHEPIYYFLGDPRWVVRGSAIGALQNSQCPHAEQKLVNLLQKTNDTFDQITCNATLNTMGTRKSLPCLQKMLASRTRDVKLSAQCAIDAIEQRHPE